MDERHTAVIIEMKKSQLQNVEHSLLGDDEQMLVNLVKLKDEEIKQLKR
jgi:hypothetical protein